MEDQETEEDEDEETQQDESEEDVGACGLPQNAEMPGP
jgi:hypothetical protein